MPCSEDNASPQWHWRDLLALLSHEGPRRSLACDLKLGIAVMARPPGHIVRGPPQVGWVRSAARPAADVRVSRAPTNPARVIAVTPGKRPRPPVVIAKKRSIASHTRVLGETPRRSLPLFVSVTPRRWPPATPAPPAPRPGADIRLGFARPWSNQAPFSSLRCCSPPRRSSRPCRLAQAWSRPPVPLRCWSGSCSAMSGRAHGPEPWAVP